MPLRPCLDCKTPTDGTRCPTCRSSRNRARDQRRGSSTARGYDHAHETTRESFAPIVAAGQASCSEPICLEPTRAITPDSEWDLAHDRDTGGYRGPAHARCNRAEGARYLATLRGHRPA